MTPTPSASPMATTASLLTIGAADRLLTLPDVLSQLSVCSSTLYALIANNQFAKPRKIGRASRWLTSDVTAFIAGLAPGQIAAPAGRSAPQTVQPAAQQSASQPTAA